MEEEKDNQENGELDQKNSVLENNENEAQKDSNEDNKNIKDLSPEDKIKELEDKLLRTVAEMDNIRKRSDKERSEAYKIGASIFIKEMLPITDNLKRALSSFTNDKKIILSPFISKMTYSKLNLKNGKTFHLLPTEGRELYLEHHRNAEFEG